jgi:CDP-diacylglycerol--serine O-phosphatidyltransferase
MDELENGSQERRRGIYLLPNLFTTGTLFAGFSAVLFAIEGRYIEAVVSIFIGMLCDALDGRVARLTNTQSDFGKEYDSLADMVCFGFAPALVMYLWSLQELGEYGRFGRQLAWTAAFFYAAMAALRLARFNVLASKTTEKKYFYGLPSPAAAAFMMGFVWVAQDFNFTGDILVAPAFIVTVAAGVLMVSSRIQYPSFKDMKGVERVPFRYLLLVVVVLILISFDPPRALYGIILFYVCLGPWLAWRLWSRERRKLRNDS